jgi:hypothetical protein
MVRRLTAEYAILARHFYEAVARLGSINSESPVFLTTLDEIVTLQDLCVESERALRAYAKDSAIPP